MTAYYMYTKHSRKNHYYNDKPFDSNETCCLTCLTVIQGPLAGFSYKMLAHAHAINAGPIFSRVGLNPSERTEQRRRNGART